MNNRKTAPLLFALLLCCALVHADALQSAIDARNAGNYQEAFQVFKELAEQGNAGAQSNLGYMYDEGEGVPQDDKEAAVWFG